MKRVGRQMIGDVTPATTQQRAVLLAPHRLADTEFHQSDFCLCPHSLQANGTRSSPGAACTRFGAPHFPHMASIRVLPCLTVRDFRSIASLISRSVSSRIACFDMSRLSGFVTDEQGTLSSRKPKDGSRGSETHQLPKPPAYSASATKRFRILPRSSTSVSITSPAFRNVLVP